MLAKHNVVEKYPLFAAVHRICKGELKPQKLIDCIRDHPEYKGT
jgi:glycerol-3-phosphate dehydrogenase (NAD+)